MNRIFTIVILTLLVLTGCDQPAEVLLVEDPDGVEVTSVVVADTSLNLSAIDSTALLPSDELQFDGVLQLNHVRIDAGNGIGEFSMARGLLIDRNRPVRSRGRTYGYQGVYMGQLLLDSQVMTTRFHWIVTPDSIVRAGVEYAHPPGFVYEEGKEYVWSSDSINAAAVSITAPELLGVVSPRGGAFISHERPLSLEWTGGTDVSIVVSMIQPGSRPRPMLHIRPRHQGRAVVPAKMLRLLPRGHDYAFTFINANREVLAVSRRFFHGEVLVQAASVHSVIVVLP
jgi:hypothetical protein